MTKEFLLLMTGKKDKAMNFIEEAFRIRNQLKSECDFKENPIDNKLHVIPEFDGKEAIKLIIIGQDPTVKSINSRKYISCTLNLDKNNALRKYVERIVNSLGITVQNVYATNLFKYFYTYPPSKTPTVLKSHLQPNLGLLKKELRTFENIPVITLGEPVLQLLTSDKAKVRSYWDYITDTGISNGRFLYSTANENKLERDFYPFPHQPSIRKEFYDLTLTEYVSFVRKTSILL